MTRLPSSRITRFLPFAAALLLGAAPALAQGTAEQREACTPDAMRLCSDTIPDVGKTTACMKRHAAELSSRCHSAFLGKEAAPGTEHARREAPHDNDDALDEVPDEDRADARDAETARTVIGELCTDGVLGSSTCNVAGQALDMAQ